MIKNGFIDIDSYIAGFSNDMQILLEQIRFAIKEAAPDSEECISYQMPAFKLNGILVYFAGCKNHIGFYPTGAGTEKFKDEITDYKSSKGAIQFPLDKPLPIELIQKIVRFRVSENVAKAELKKLKIKKDKTK